MKPFLLLWASVAIAFAQGSPQCSQALTFTGATSGPTKDATQGCVGWRLTWTVTGFSGATIQIEGSQDNSSWVAFSGAVVIEGSNPTLWTAATASNSIVVRASRPYIRVNVTHITGSGTIKTNLYGYIGTSAQWDAGGGSSLPVLPNHSTVLGTGLASLSSTGPAAAGTILTSNGAAADPSYQPPAFSGSLTYYLTPTASSIATYLQQTVSPYSPKTTLPYAAIPIGTDTLQNWATNAGNPNLSFIPAGIYVFHVHALNSSGGNVKVFAQFWEVSALGVDIAQIGQTESSVQLTNVETEYSLVFADGNVYALGSTASRIVVRLFAVVTGFAANVQVFVGGTADSHISLPSNTVDSTFFVPYTGATADVTLGAHGLTVGSSAVGNSDFSATGHSVPTRTGTGAPTGTNCSKVGELFFQTDGTAGQNIWAATTFGTPCTWSLQTVSTVGFVPYTGATGDVTLGAHGLTVGSGAVGNSDFSATGHSVPTRTGTGAPTGTNCSKVGELFFQTNATAGSNVWLATTFGTPCTWTQLIPGTASNVLGTATWDSSSGSIVGLYMSGIVTGVSRDSTGIYDCYIQPKPDELRCCGICTNQRFSGFFCAYRQSRWRLHVQRALCGFHYRSGQKRLRLL